MKSISVFLALFVSQLSFASCPNFSGRFNSLDGEIYRVFQTNCSAIRILAQEGIMRPATEFNFVLDGKRHEIGGIFWAAYWAGDSFVREPWSAETEGVLYGDREVWTLKTDAGGLFIHQQIVYPENGTIVSEKKFRKAP